MSTKQKVVGLATSVSGDGRWDQWCDQMKSKLEKPWYLVETSSAKSKRDSRNYSHSNVNCENNASYETTDTMIYTDQQSIPNGVFYMRHFLTIEQERRLLQLIDDDHHNNDNTHNEKNHTNNSNNNDNNNNKKNSKWSTVIARRQQFWGDVYYHTKHDVPSIQPTIEDFNKRNNHNPNNERDENNENDDYYYLPPSLDISKMDWLLQLLESIGTYVDASNGGSFVYKGKPMIYHSNPIGVFTATKSTGPVVVNTYDTNNNNAIVDKQNNQTEQDVDKNVCPIETKRDDDDEKELPTQVLVNEYLGSIGIFGHIDDPFAFGQVLVMVSLHDPIIMRLTKTKNATNADHQQHKESVKNEEVVPVQEMKVEIALTDENEIVEDEVNILLEPRSVLILKGQSRFEYEHAITKQKWIVVNHFVQTKQQPHDQQQQTVVKMKIEGQENNFIAKQPVDSLPNALIPIYDTDSVTLLLHETLRYVSRNGMQQLVTHHGDFQDGGSLFKQLPVAHVRSIATNNEADHHEPYAKQLLLHERQQDHSSSYFNVLIYQRKIGQYRRVSLTIRHLLDGRKRVPISNTTCT